MIPRRFETVLFQFLISSVMSCLVSTTVTLVNLGFDGFSLGNWFKAWMLAWSIAFPAIVVFSPLVRRGVKSLVKKD